MALELGIIDGIWNEFSAYKELVWIVHRNTIEIGAKIPFISKVLNCNNKIDVALEFGMIDRIWNEFFFRRKNYRVSLNDVQAFSKMCNDEVWKYEISLNETHMSVQQKS